MRTTYESYTSSRKSPHNVECRSAPHHDAFYPGMLLKDVAASFSTEFEARDQHEQFYSIKPAKGNLKNLLSFQNHGFIEYGLDDLLCEIVMDMAVSDRVFLELVKWQDANQIVKGISFAAFTPLWHFVGQRNTYFISLVRDKQKLCFYHIPNQYVSMLSMRDLGLPRAYFRRLFAALKKYDITRTADLSINAEKTHFSIDEYSKREEFGLLKCTQLIGWCGRKYDNRYLGESYLLLRQTRFKELRRRLLLYIVKQINALLQNSAEELGYSGRITINCNFIPFEQSLEKLRSGVINTSKYSDILLGKKTV